MTQTLRLLLQDELKTDVGKSIDEIYISLKSYKPQLKRATVRGRLSEMNNIHSEAKKEGELWFKRE